MIVIADQNWGLLVSLIAIIISSAITTHRRMILTHMGRSPETDASVP